MEVTVVLYSTLVSYQPAGGGNSPFTVELPEGSNVEDLFNKLGIDPDEVKQVFIRHRKCPPDHPLEDGDRVAIFPPVGGG